MAVLLYWLDALTRLGECQGPFWLSRAHRRDFLCQFFQVPQAPPTLAQEHSD